MGTKADKSHGLPCNHLERYAAQCSTIADFDFLKLPPEIRNQIYEFALVRDTAIEIWSQAISHAAGLWRKEKHPKYPVYEEALDRWMDASVNKLGRHSSEEVIVNGAEIKEQRIQWSSSVDGRSLNLLFTNRVISSEASSIFYSQNRFGDCFGWDWRMFESFLERIGPLNRAYLCDLHIQVGPVPRPYINTGSFCEWCNSWLDTHNAERSLYWAGRCRRSLSIKTISTPYH